MATTRSTMGAILGSVSGAATTVTDTLDTVNKSVGLLNRFVTKVSDKQVINDKLDMHEFASRLIEEKAMEEALRKKTILEFCKKEEGNQELFEEAYNRFANILNVDNSKA